MKEEIESGESSLDIIMRVYGVLKDYDMKLYNKFASAYESYANDEVEIEEDLLQKVYEALGKAPEPKEEKDPFGNLGKQ